MKGCFKNRGEGEDLESGSSKAEAFLVHEGSGRDCFVLRKVKLRGEIR